MTRRTRLIAGLLALAASTFAHAETVLASTCAPAMDMQMVEPAAPHASADHCMLDTRSDCGERDGDARHCPFGPAAMAQGCAGVASLPAHALSPIAPSPEGVIATFIEQSEHDLILGKSLFRPPRA